MAIGSEPEIGITFARYGEMNEAERQAWFRHMRTWGPDLLNGYGTLCHPKRGADVEPLPLV